MSILDSFAHSLIGVFAIFGRMMLDALEFVERGLRGLMSGAGLGGDVQTLLLIVLLGVFLLGAVRLLRGRLRLLVGQTLFLVLAHVLERMSRGGF